MGKDFGNTVKRPRRNRLQAEIEKGMGGEPETAAQIDEVKQEDPAAQIEEVKQEEPAAQLEDQEIGKRLAEGKTQGKKGLHAKRINMAFRPSVYHYIHVMAGSYGISMTDFINESLLRQMKNDSEFWELEDIKRRREARMKAEEGRE